MLLTCILASMLGSLPHPFDYVSLGPQDVHVLRSPAKRAAAEAITSLLQGTVRRIDGEGDVMLSVRDAHVHDLHCVDAEGHLSKSWREQEACGRHNRAKHRCLLEICDQECLDEVFRYTADAFDDWSRGG